MNDVENTFIEDVAESEEAFEDYAEAEEVDEMSLLKTELEALRMELKSRDEREALNSRMIKELNEFQEYFPEVEIRSIPNDIWEQVKNGASLSASFALNLRKIEIERKKVSDFNEKNRRMSAGALLQGDGEKFYSPSEVKRMSPAQVRAHYDDIVESMRHWN